jgi:hypothetical protein
MHLFLFDQFLTYSVMSKKLSGLWNISGLGSMLAAYQIMKRHQMEEIEQTECLHNILTNFYDVSTDGVWIGN